MAQNFKRTKRVLLLICALVPIILNAGKATSVDNLNKDYITTHMYIINKKEIPGILTLIQNKKQNCIDTATLEIQDTTYCIVSTEPGLYKIANNRIYSDEQLALLMPLVDFIQQHRCCKTLLEKAQVIQLLYKLKANRKALLSSFTKKK